MHEAISGHQLIELVRLVDSFIAMKQVPTTRSDLRTLSANARQLVTNLISTRSDIEEAIAFFDQANLERFAKWANENKFDGMSCKAEAGVVILTNDDTGKSLRIERPRDLRSIEDERFNDLEKASRAFQMSFQGKVRAA
jgi:hypothetical protein